MEIVGVVDDLVTDVSVLEPLTLYFPEPQSSEPSSYRTIVVRVASSSDAAAREVGSAVARIDAAVARPALITLEDRVARQMSAQRLGAVVLGALGTIAVLLTVLGIYVLAESLAVLRMREMGIRAALGATRRQLGAIVLADTGRLVGLGLLVGLLLAWAGAGTISAFLFQIRPLDPATLLGVALAIFGLALAVSLRPAVRAARVDLASILKAQ
jgi:ABC-type antimicrobial peptide transport system permease subunit